MLSHSCSGELYRALEVSSNATDAEIRSAFRRAALRLHPDRSGADTTAAFQHLQHAYAVLSKPDRRSLYDRLGSAGMQAQSGLFDSKLYASMVAKPWLLRLHLNLLLLLMVGATAFWVLLALRLDRHIRWNWYAVWVPALPLAVLLGVVALLVLAVAVRFRLWVPLVEWLHRLLWLGAFFVGPAAAEGYVPAFVPVLVALPALCLQSLSHGLMLRPSYLRSQAAALGIDPPLTDSLQYAMEVVHTVAADVGLTGSAFLLLLRLTATSWRGRSAFVLLVPIYAATAVQVAAQVWHCVCLRSASPPKACRPFEVCRGSWFASMLLLVYPLTMLAAKAELEPRGRAVSAFAALWPWIALTGVGSIALLVVANCCVNRRPGVFGRAVPSEGPRDEVIQSYATIEG